MPKQKKYLQSILSLLLTLTLLTQSTAPLFTPTLSQAPSPNRLPPTTPPTPPTTHSQPPTTTHQPLSTTYPPALPTANSQRLTANGQPPTTNRLHRDIQAPLPAGWNLISLNELPDNTDPTVVLASLAGNYTSAFAYDGCDPADPWKRYDPADIPGSDLTAIDHTIGLWLDLTTPGVLDVTSTSQLSTTIHLCLGWNLISYPLQQPQSLEKALAPIEGQYSRVFAYESASGADPWTVFSPSADEWGNDLDVMLPGRGYWIFAEQETDLTFIEPPGPDITLPQVTVFASPEIVDPGETVYLAVTATDDTTIISRTLTVNGISQTLDQYGQTTYIPTVPGIYTATGTATDLDGNTGTATATFRARSPIDDGPPTVALIAPAGDTIISVTHPLTGTATDSDLAYYELQIRPLGGDFTTFQRAFTSVLSDTLGTLDPRAFLPGLYDLRVCAEDLWGNQACSGFLRYDLNAPNPLPGIINMAFLDGQVSASGLPITVRRIYDSRDKRVGDFGVGWRLSLGEVTLYANRIMGNDWEEQNIGNNYFIVPTADHRVTVSLPDGRFYRFRMHPDPESQAFIPIDTLDGVIFEPLGNTTAQLTTSDPPAFFDSVTGTILEGDGSIYSPDDYILTLEDGSQMTFDRDGSVAELNYILVEVQDPNGNTLTFSPTGITHSAGANVGFTRDGAGRITAMTDGNGNTRTYTYDPAGNLISTTDYDSYLTQYIYDDNHNLLQLIDPRGLVPGTLIYDDLGRIVATIDDQGNRVEFAHDEIIGQDIVTDHLGNQTILNYDRRGNLISEINPLGHTTSYTYDNNDNLLSHTNPLGHTETWTYDPAGHQLSHTNAMSHTTHWEYNAQGRVLTQTDALSRTTSFGYDATGNLTSLTNALGETITFEVDPNGNRTALTDPLGNRVEFAYDSLGRMTRRTDPLGHVTIATYDGNGLPLTESMTMTTDAGLENITVINAYDQSGRLLQRTDPAGNILDITYSPLGQPDTVTDRNGATTLTSYATSGYIDETTLPTGASATQLYDPRGLPSRQTDFNGNATDFTYNSAGRTAAVTSADGTAIGWEYNPAGAITTFTDEQANPLTLAYDPVGRQTEVNDGGRLHTTTYDAVGNITSVTRPGNRTTQYQYDDLNRPIRTIYPDSSETTTTYDPAGRIIAETDPLGQTTQFGYNVRGELTVVTDTLGYTTTYTYNEGGKLTSVTDPLRRTTTFTYNRLGLLTSRTLPGGQTEYFAYDANGNLTSYTDFIGQTTTYTYNPLNLVETKNFPDGSQTSFTYTPAGQIATTTDAQGTTTFTYDVRNRLTSVSYPTGHTLSYTYHPDGSLATRTTPAGTTAYTYDTHGRLRTVTDPDSGVYTYTYDIAGNIAQLTFPNNATMTATYDLNNRPLQIIHRDPSNTPIASYTYTYDTLGRRTGITDLDGTTTTYQYDTLSRLTREIVSDTLGTTLHDNSYTYDAIGNRLTQTTLTGTITYTYDLNDRLLASSNTTFSYDGNGSLIARTENGTTTQYAYDYEARLLAVISPTLTISYTYNALGARVAQEIGGTVTNFLVDTNTALPQIVEERDSGGALQAAYVLGNGYLSSNIGGNRLYHHTDAHANLRLLTDPAGATTDTYTYDAFGNLRQHSGIATVPYLYASERYEPLTQLYYLRARSYAPDLGRFTSADQVVGKQSTPATLNRYVYVGNNPVNLIDPSGFFSAAESLVAVHIATTLQSMQAVFGMLFFNSFTIFSNPALLQPPAHAGRVTFTGGVGVSFLNLASFGVTGGLETLYFTPEARQRLNPLQFYGYLGLATSMQIALPTPSISVDFSVGAELGHVFNCAESIDCYDGWAFGNTVSGGYGGGSLALSIFSGGATVGGAANGYGVGFSFSGSFGSFDTGLTAITSDLLGDISGGLGTSAVYYLRAPSVPSHWYEYALLTLVPAMQAFGQSYAAESLATPGPIRSAAETVGPAVLDFFYGTSNR